MRSMRQEFAFDAGDYVVYPTHGVGKVLGVETREIAGQELQLFVITFDRDRMTLRVPVAKAATAGLRRLSTRKVMESALTTLKGRARVKRTMWSRRAQEYEAKIERLNNRIRELSTAAGRQPATPEADRKGGGGFFRR